MYWYGLWYFLVGVWVFVLGSLARISLRLVWVFVGGIRLDCGYGVVRDCACCEHKRDTVNPKGNETLKGTWAQENPSLGNPKQSIQREHKTDFQNYDEKHI